MFRNLFLIFALLCLIAGLTLWFDYKSNPGRYPGLPETAKALQAPAPDFKFTTIEGRSAKLSDLRGKIVILHFWASWCPPCVSEFPKLLTISKEFENDMVLLAISSDKSAEDIGHFLKRNALTGARGENIHMVFDKDRAITHDMYQSFAYPETILIGRNGEMIRKIAGDADWTSDDMRFYLRSLAAEAQTP